jgi:hypothetical protein
VNQMGRPPLLTLQSSALNFSREVTREGKKIVAEAAHSAEVLATEKKECRGWLLHASFFKGARDGV